MTLKGEGYTSLMRGIIHDHQTRYENPSRYWHELSERLVEAARIERRRAVQVAAKKIEKAVKMEGPPCDASCKCQRGLKRGIAAVKRMR